MDAELIKVAKVSCKFYNNYTNPNSEPNRPSRLMKDSIYLNGSWIDERTALLK